MNEHDELVERITTLTGLNARAAAVIATALEAEDELPTAARIVEVGRELGYEFEPTGASDPNPPAFMPEISMDAATVLAEVYENCPRVLMSAFPSIGRAPTELQAHPDLMAEINELPDEIRCLLAKVNLVDEQMTIWLRDEANDVDRPIGPIDLRPYTTGDRLHQAIATLLRRLPLVLRADSN